MRGSVDRQTDCTATLSEPLRTNQSRYGARSERRGAAATSEGELYKDPTTTLNPTQSRHRPGKYKMTNPK